MIPIIIRPITPPDAAQHNMVASQAFIYRIKPEELNQFPTTPVIGAFADDNSTLIAQLEINAMQSRFCGNSLKCVGVGGVATKPEFRRTGAVRKLFDHLFEQDWDISALYPFSSSYYRKFGYETSGLGLRASTDFTELSHIERSSSVELFDGSQLDTLLELYNKTFKNYNLSFIRADSKHFADKPYETTNYTYMWKNTEGEYKSFATYHVDREKSCVTVNEIGFTDRESMLGILGFLRCYDGNQRTISFTNLPIDSPLINVFGNLNRVTMGCYNVGAIRVINVENVLKAKLWPEEHGSFILRCNDTVSRNNKTFEVEYQNGKCSVTITDKLPDVVLEPYAASKILLTGFDGREDNLSFVEGAEFKSNCNDFIKAFKPMGAFFTGGF